MWRLVASCGGFSVGATVIAAFLAVYAHATGCATSGATHDGPTSPTAIATLAGLAYAA